MDFKKLEYLESVYRLQSFSKAAEEHYISQPSISSAIQKLEFELEMQLIDRNSKPLKFTPEGTYFMSHVYKILDTVSTAVQDMKSLADSQKQVLHMVIHSTLDDWILTRIFSDFHENYPQYEIHLHEQIHQIMLDNLLSGKIDLAYSLIPEDIDLDLFETIPIQSCELYVLLPKNHPLEQYERIPLGMLKSECLLTFPSGSLILSRLQRDFQQLHIAPKFRTLSQVRIMQNLVEQNCGISFVTKDELSQLTDTSTYSVRPLQEPINYLKGFILKRGSQKNAAINCTISYVQNTVQEERRKKTNTFHTHP